MYYLGIKAYIKIYLLKKLHFYTEKDNPIDLIAFNQKVFTLKSIDEYIRRKDNRITQVSASITTNWKAIHILRIDGQQLSDIRPLIRIDVGVVMEQDGRMEKGSWGYGGRNQFEQFITTENWKNACDKALAQANVNMESIPAPAGEQTVVLGAGWPGILLHEAVGHGLEGDFNRKKTSAFSGLIGERVASKGVTVIDDGTIKDRRGSLNIDDEGTPTNKTVLMKMEF